LPMRIRFRFRERSFMPLSQTELSTAWQRRE